jgi:large subunit ribosomal protein L25
MDQVSLSAEHRQGSGTRPSRRLRAEGGIPGVLYGRGLDSTPLTVDRRDLYAALHTEAGTNALINLEVGADKYLTVARELQRHPVRGDIIHLDFIRIVLDEKITAEVGIDYMGEPEGAKEGGILETIRTSVMISALPTDIPASIQMDISALEVGMTLSAADLPVIEGVEYLEDSEAPLVNVIIPRILEVEAPEVELDEDGVPIVPVELDEDGVPIEVELDEDGNPIVAEEAEASGEGEGSSTDSSS